MLPKLPKVAIICANYNYGDYIIPAIESIINQTYEGPLRLYVVDDGSSDATGEIGRQYGARVIRQENRGAPSTWYTDERTRPGAPPGTPPCLPGRSCSHRR